MASRFFFSSAARRALLGFSGLPSPFASKCSVVPLCLSPSSNMTSLNPLWGLPAATITIAPVRFFSASEGVGVSADEHLKRVIQAQIRRGEEEVDTEFFVPKDFPFEIVDNSGEQTITLRRNCYGENIEVDVELPDWLLEKEEENKEEDFFVLTIKIDKGENTYLEFNGYLFSKSIHNHEMHLKSHQVLEGTEKAWDLEETMTRAAVKYLKARGIDGSLWEFLKKYMVIKNNREHLDWLKTIIGFFQM